MNANPNRWSTLVLVKAACVIGLLAIAQMVLSIIVPSALPVIAAMSAGQAMGVVAFLCYLLAVVTEVRKHDKRRKASRDSQS